MKSEPITILAVTTFIRTDKVYIKWFSRKSTGKLIPIYTNNPEEAHDFISDLNADDHIRRFINHANRIFEKECLEIKIKKNLSNDSV